MMEKGEEKRRTFSSKDIEDIMRTVEKTVLRSLKENDPGEAYLIVSLDTDEREGGLRAKVEVEVRGAKKPLPPEEVAARILYDTVQALEDKVLHERNKEDKEDIRED